MCHKAFFAHISVSRDFYRPSTRKPGRMAGLFRVYGVVYLYLTIGEDLTELYRIGIQIDMLYPPCAVVLSFIEHRQYGEHDIFLNKASSEGAF